MRVQKLLLLATAAWLVSMPSLVCAAPSRSMAEVAMDVAKKLPKGAIVTSESIRGDVSINSAGTLEPLGSSPKSAVFEIGSITKVFTGLLLAIAVQEGKVTLDSTVADILGAQQNFSDVNVGKITLRQLATHTSGLPRLPDNMLSAEDVLDPYAHYDRTKLSSYLATAHLIAPPPSDPVYSNLGAGLLGDLLSRVYGMTWEALVRTKITEPLGMRDTVARLSSDQIGRLAPPYAGDHSVKPWTSDALAGAGVLRSTASDMLAFGAALLDPDRTRLAGPIKLLLAPQPPTDTGLFIYRSQVDGQLVYEHSGGTGGYRTYFQVIPASNTVRVVLINNSTGSPEAILAGVRGEQVPAYIERPVSPTALTDYVGVYGSDPALRLTMLVHDGRLMVRLTRQAFLPVFPEEKDDRFFYKAVDAELQFERSRGAVTAVTLFQGGRELRMPKIDVPLPTITFQSPNELQEYTGVYKLPDGHILTIKISDNTLFGRLNDTNFVSVFKSQQDEYVADGAPATLRFIRNPDGIVSALELLINGKTQRAEKE